MTKIDDWQKNAILLRRKSKILLEPGNGELPLSYVASILKNLEGLGYCCSPALSERMQTLSEKDILVFYEQLISTLKEMVGAHVDFSPMYPNFPKQVMETSESELYINALMHYLGDDLGIRILPRYEKQERSVPSDFFDLKMIDLGEEKELQLLAQQLVGAKTSISQTDKEDLALLVGLYREQIELILPLDIPHKENLAYFTSLLLGHHLASDVLLTRYFKTSTDILRLATAMSEGDVSLATNTKFRSFKRAERRLLLALLERCAAPIEDMLRYKGRWIRLGERLHPTEYQKKYPKAAEAFDVLRNNKPFQTFYGKVEAALKKADVETLLRLLRKRPGELARRLDHLLRISNDPSVVHETFAEVAERVATPVLLQVMAHFKQRNVPQGVRAFFPKGNVAKVFSVANELPSLSEDICLGLVNVCREALIERFARLPALGNVYLDKKLRHYLVPFSQRSASKALRTLVRGSVIPLPEGDTIRFFLWWKEGEVNGVSTGRVDIDLSSAMYGEKWNYLEHISYTNLKSSKYLAAHSGDITSAPNGACEFIDLDIPSVVKYGGRYVIMNVLSFTGQTFDKIPECLAGWMMRDKPGSGEIFEPSTVVDKIDLSADTRICIPVILDLVERKMIWADLALKSRPKWHINIESNQRGIVHLAQAITTLIKPNLYDLFELHTAARGSEVGTKEEADILFSTNEGITPFSVEEIMAEYL